MSAKKALWEVLKYDPNVAFISPAGSMVMHDQFGEHSDHDFAAVGFRPNNRLVLHPDKLKKRTIDIFYYDIDIKIQSLKYLSSDPMQYPYEMYHWLLVDFFSNHIVHMTQIGSVMHDNRYLFLCREGVSKCIDYTENVHKMIEDPNGVWDTDRVWKTDFRMNRYSTKFAKMNIYILRLMNSILETGEVQILQERGAYYPLDSYRKEFDVQINRAHKANLNRIPELRVDQLESLRSLLLDIRD